MLIVDDMAETAQNVQKLLHYERDIKVVGIASSGREPSSSPTSSAPMSS